MSALSATNALRKGEEARELAEDASFLAELEPAARPARSWGKGLRVAAGAVCLLGVASAAALLRSNGRADLAVGAPGLRPQQLDQRSVVSLALSGDNVRALLANFDPSRGRGLQDPPAATMAMAAPGAAVVAGSSPVATQEIDITPTGTKAALPTPGEVVAGIAAAVAQKVNDTITEKKAEIVANIKANTPLGQLEIKKTEVKNSLLNKVGKTAVTPEAAADLLAKAKKEGWGGDDTAQDLRVASCTLNVLQASNYVARAGVQIDQATKSCKAPGLVGYSSAYKKEACAANAAGIFASVAWVATYLSLATSQCAKTAPEMDVPAICAATIEGFVAALAGLAVQANFVASSCLPDSEEITAANTETDAVWQMAGRRLDSEVDGKFAPDRDGELATCVLDVTEAATLLAQMGLNIKAASRSCPLWDYTKDVPVVNGNTHAICSLDIGHVLWSAGQAATFIAAATSHCAEGINVRALCASGVAGLVSSLAGVVYLGSGVSLACVELPKLGPLENPVAKELGQGIARRLGANLTVV